MISFSLYWSVYTIFKRIWIGFNQSCFIINAYRSWNFPTYSSTLILSVASRRSWRIHWGGTNLSRSALWRLRLSRNILAKIFNLDIIFSTLWRLLRCAYIIVLLNKIAFLLPLLMLTHLLATILQLYRLQAYKASIYWIWSGRLSSQPISQGWQFVGKKRRAKIGQRRNGRLDSSRRRAHTRL